MNKRAQNAVEFAIIMGIFFFAFGIFFTIVSNSTSTVLEERTQSEMLAVLNFIDTQINTASQSYDGFRGTFNTHAVIRSEEFGVSFDPLNRVVTVSDQTGQSMHQLLNERGQYFGTIEKGRNSFWYSVDYGLQLCPGNYCSEHRGMQLGTDIECRVVGNRYWGFCTTNTNITDVRVRCPDDAVRANITFSQSGGTIFSENTTSFQVINSTHRWFTLNLNASGVGLINTGSDSPTYLARCFNNDGFVLASPTDLGGVADYKREDTLLNRTFLQLQTSFCGDGVVEGAEDCDGNSRACTTASGYPGFQTCNSQCNGWSSCVATGFCGDGIVHTAAGEECDAGQFNGMARSAWYDVHLSRCEYCTNDCRLAPIELAPDFSLTYSDIVSSSSHFFFMSDYFNVPDRSLQGNMNFDSDYFNYFLAPDQSHYFEQLFQGSYVIELNKYVCRSDLAQQVTIQMTSFDESLDCPPHMDAGDSGNPYLTGCWGSCGGTSPPGTALTHSRVGGYFNFFDEHTVWTFKEVEDDFKVMQMDVDNELNGCEFTCPQGQTWNGVNCVEISTTASCPSGFYDFMDPYLSGCWAVCGGERPGDSLWHSKIGGFYQPGEVSEWHFSPVEEDFKFMQMDIDNELYGCEFTCPQGQTWSSNGACVSLSQLSSCYEIGMKFEHLGGWYMVTLESVNTEGDIYIFSTDKALVDHSTDICRYNGDWIATIII